MRITHLSQTLQTTIESVPAEGTMFESPAFKVFDFLFGIPLIHDIMFGIYRKQIVEKAGKKIEHSEQRSVFSASQQNRRIHTIRERFTSIRLLGFLVLRR
jgi:hypothetical protein